VEFGELKRQTWATILFMILISFGTGAIAGTSGGFDEVEESPAADQDLNRSTPIQKVKPEITNPAAPKQVSPTPPVVPLNETSSSPKKLTALDCFNDRFTLKFDPPDTTLICRGEENGESTDQDNSTFAVRARYPRKKQLNTVIRFNSQTRGCALIEIDGNHDASLISDDALLLEERFRDEHETKKYRSSKKISIGRLDGFYRGDKFVVSDAGTYTIYTKGSARGTCIVTAPKF
jgi:hypothetical protein